MWERRHWQLTALCASRSPLLMMECTSQRASWQRSPPGLCATDRASSSKKRAEATPARLQTETTTEEGDKSKGDEAIGGALLNACRREYEENRSCARTRRAIQAYEVGSDGEERKKGQQSSSEIGIEITSKEESGGAIEARGSGGRRSARTPLL